MASQRRTRTRKYWDLWAFYSPLAAENCGTVWYLTEDGREVECTEFTRSPDGFVLHGDAKFVGKVVRFLRNGVEPKGSYKT
jgi:hypothetical protein